MLEQRTKKLVIIGASGHGKVVADIAALNGYKDIVFLDDDESIKECGKYPVVGRTEDLVDGELFVAIGNGEIRKKFMDQYKQRNFPVLIHPKTVIAEDVEVDEGTVIMAGAVINSGTRIGRGCVVNTSSSIDHDCTVKDYVHVSVGAHLCGTVMVGEGTWVGAGVTISNNVSICADCLIGAGAVVIKDITQAGTYIGVPAKMKNRG